MKAKDIIGYLTGLLLFVILVPLIMMVQVSHEEKRLEEDFGEEYREYCRNTSKLIPHIW